MSVLARSCVSGKSANIREWEYEILWKRYKKEIKKENLGMLSEKISWIILFWKTKFKR